MPAEVCEEREVCGPVSKMECKTEYEQVCTEQEQELCEPVKECKTVYKNVCDGGACSPRLVDECHESGSTDHSVIVTYYSNISYSDEEVCEVVLVQACNQLPHKACQLVDKEECSLQTSCRTMLRTVRQVQCS